ncbi:protein-L-isoaspartate(D-aspartate) O-methyltransferase [Deferribacter autotrophicus]|uniref:Protein-L-isoaspartate O-methyltransferase n=1 Tax=Deferribacter autotrophicus TaxID=500465 RepID=A0A5A8F4K0_9BACT|nr:protein-L-isoaspartate(D-aspartate) O-methyltransferase [Deferribacter autotrophicus]KAA0258521.1 protein-L-isoaspartate(D-aspartate) O-methyltransferase [Deferribacter autotrophicus]
MKIPEDYIQKIILPSCNYDKRIAEAFIKIPRHYFVDEALHKLAYKDEALPIGFGQTISKPSTVAKMTFLLDPKPADKVLEIGTGSGFQAAILSKLASEVFTVERISGLYKRASSTIRKLFINNVRFKIDNGKIGWEENAPFDKIIVTAEAENFPDELLLQLKNNGKMVIPIKGILKVFTKKDADLIEEAVSECKFVKFVT